MNVRVGLSMQIPQFVFESGICFPTMLFPSTASAASELLRGSDEPAAASTAGAGADVGAPIAAAGLLSAQAADASASDSRLASGGVGFVSASAAGKAIEVKRQLRICVTQPRRVAAVALARRVAEEMGAPQLVGYQVHIHTHGRENIDKQVQQREADGHINDES